MRFGQKPLQFRSQMRDHQPMVNVGSWNSFRDGFNLLNESKSRNVAGSPPFTFDLV
jgi:hypothetical protein